MDVGVEDLRAGKQKTGAGGGGDETLQLVQRPGTNRSRFKYFGPKWGRLARDGTNPGLFQIRFPYILAQKCTEISDLKKSRICPISGQSAPLWAQI